MSREFWDALGTFAAGFGLAVVFLVHGLELRRPLEPVGMHDIRARLREEMKRPGYCDPFDCSDGGIQVCRINPGCSEIDKRMGWP